MRIQIQEQNGTRHELDMATHAPQTLAAAVYQSGLVAAQALCTGLGRCGACRMRVVSDASLPPLTPKEHEVLSASDREAGWRLACQIPAIDGIFVELPAPPSKQHKILHGHATGSSLALAVDIGTTSVHWAAVSVKDGTLIAQGSGLNPQMGAGADCMSRIAVAITPEGAKRLQKLMFDTLQATCVAVEEQTGGRIERMILSGNTAMLAIISGANVESLAYAPYGIAEKGGRTITRADLPQTINWTTMPSAWLMPAFAPFVGGDISSGLWYLQKYGIAKDWQEPWLFVDMGTNGECALIEPDGHIFVSSVPLGPALEGIALACGGVAQAGSIDGVSVGVQGLIYHVIEPASGNILGYASPNIAPVNICATGYISLIALLLQLGIITQDGTLAPQTPHGSHPPHPPHPLASIVRKRIEIMPSGRWRLFITDTLFLDVLDVEAILKVKASLAVAIKTLLNQAGVSPHDISHLALAGALGEYVDMHALERCGFVPCLWRERLHAVGNTSLLGAMHFASHADVDVAMAELADMVSRTTLVSLTDATFMERYMDTMHFCW